VQIRHFSTLESVGLTKVQMSHVPRSIVMWSFGASNDNVHLLVGTGSGQLVSFKVNTTRILAVDMSSRRSISLGDRPVHLQICVVDNKSVVIATSIRTVIISCSNGRITQHHINVKVC